MNEQGLSGQATPHDIKEQKRKCFWTDCNKTAWFEDWAGWRYCLRHTYYTIRFGGGNIWWEIKKLRLYFWWTK